MPEKISLAAKFAQFSDQWAPRIVAELNGQQVKLVRFAGPFVWHAHEHEDEMFLVLSGRLRIELEGADDVELGPGQFFVVPRGVRHNPVADEEVHIALIETVTTAHTGDVTVPETVPVDQQVGDFV